MDPRKFLTIAIAILQTFMVFGWKPISGTPASFLIRQSHPVIGSSHSRNTITDSTGSAVESLALTGSSNIGYLDDDEEQPFSALLGGSESHITGYSDDLQTEGRILSSHGSNHFAEDACSVDKYAFDNEGTIHYQHHMPKLEQFTLCMWMRFVNHSGDHTIYTYSVDDEPREIQFWIANVKGSSFISLAVHGQQIFRLNYPLKMRIWHHACASWNGKTGEWQLWVKSERVGRGFHNRLVNFAIRPHGISYSGGPSKTGPTTDGLHAEITLVQLYKVALSAGKAHRDHKHHHVHHFNHDGLAPTTTTRAPPTPTAPQPLNPLLANGQIISRVRINFAGAENNAQQLDGAPAQGLPSQVVGGVLPNPPTITTNFVNGQYASGQRLLTQQLLRGIGPQSNQQSQSQSQPGQIDQAIQFPGFTSNRLSSTTSFSSPSLSNPAGVQFITSDDNAGSSGFDTNGSGSSRFFFKRDGQSQIGSEDAHKNDEKIVQKRETARARRRAVKKIVNKRGLVMLDNGSIIDDTLLAAGYQFDGLAQFGLPNFKENLQKHMNIEDEIREHDMEPAEDEVRAVMALCTSCDTEPFKGAVVMTWKDVQVQQEHTLKGRSVGGCGFF